MSKKIDSWIVNFLVNVSVLKKDIHFENEILKKCIMSIIKNCDEIYAIINEDNSILEDTIGKKVNMLMKFFTLNENSVRCLNVNEFLEEMQTLTI